MRNGRGPNTEAEDAGRKTRQSCKGAQRMDGGEEKGGSTGATRRKGRATARKEEGKRARESEGGEEIREEGGEKHKHQGERAGDKTPTQHRERSGRQGRQNRGDPSGASQGGGKNGRARRATHKEDERPTTRARGQEEGNEAANRGRKSTAGRRGQGPKENREGNEGRQGGGRGETDENGQGEQKRPHRSRDKPTKKRRAGKIAKGSEARKGHEEGGRELGKCA